MYSRKQTSSEAAKSSSKRNASSNLRRKAIATSRDITCSGFSATPMNRKPDLSCTAKRSEFTSTPAADVTSFPVCDASAIAADQSYMPVIKEPLGGAVGRKKVLPKLHSHGGFNSLGKQKVKDPKIDEQIEEAELNILYCQYIQALYLESRAKKSLEKRSEDALENLHKLWVANQVLMEQELTLQKELDGIRYVTQLLQHCQSQKKVLDPAADEISKIMSQYEEIACAVDSIRHKLHIPYISLPSDMSSEAELAADLAKQCEFLSQAFLDALSSKSTELVQSSDLLKKIINLMDKLAREIRKGTGLLTTADHLTATETSLKITEIQERERKSC